MMRRRTLTTALLCLLAVCTSAQDRLPASPQTPDIDLNARTILCGDANGDGTVNIDDAIAVSHHIIGKKQATFNEEAADVNADGKIDISDIAIIINYVVLHP